MYIVRKNSITGEVEMQTDNNRQDTKYKKKTGRTN